MLTDELTDRLINILTEAEIQQADKLRFDFMLSKDRLEVERIGNSMAKNKLLVLPVHFAFKQENEFTADLIEKVKANYPRISKLDLSKLKEMFVLSPQELRFAMLCEIRRANWDYVIVDTFAIGMIATFAISLVHYADRFLRSGTMSAFSQNSLAVLISLVSLGIYFFYKDLAYDEYVDQGLIKTSDIDLVEGGLHYLNKQIQLNKLLGNDATGLERRLVKFKALYEKLKEYDRLSKAQEAADDSDESDSDDEDDEEKKEEREAKRSEIGDRLKTFHSKQGVI